MAREPKRMIEDPSRLSGSEKAAVILLALGEEDHSLWTMMDEEEIREVSSAMSNLGNVSSKVVERLIVNFAGQMSSGGSVMGSFEATQRLLGGFLPEGKVETIMEDPAFDEDRLAQQRLQMQTWQEAEI